MAYVAVADFRTATLAEFCAKIDLTPAEAADAALTAAIARMSERIDEATGDHFEPTAASFIELDGPDSSTLYLPKRIRTVTAVKTRDADGVLTTEAATVYRVISSLNTAGTDFAYGELFDRIEVISTKMLASGKSTWPEPVGSVRVEGDFDWAACPADIKRAVALLVYDHFKPATENLHRATQWSVHGATFDRATSEPFGLPEVDAIVAQYRRVQAPAF